MGYDIERIADEAIVGKIHKIRGRRVMLDKDLADLYEVETKVLNQAVKRNSDRFPIDFMFQLSENEWEILRSQNVTSSYGGRRYMPYVFTEQGVAMLSSVLRSDRAIQVNIHIMRVYIQLREVLLTGKDVLDRIDAIENRADAQEAGMQAVLKFLNELAEDNEDHEGNKPRKQIGFRRTAQED
jgi:hypothetical protein